MWVLYGYRRGHGAYALLIMKRVDLLTKLTTPASTRKSFIYFYGCHAGLLLGPSFLRAWINSWHLKSHFTCHFHYPLSFFAVTFLITTTVRARDGGERNESLKKQFWATFINVLQCIITRVTSTVCLRRIYYGPWRIDLDEATQACLSTCCHSAARISAQRQFVNWSVFRCLHSKSNHVVAFAFFLLRELEMIDRWISGRLAIISSRFRQSEVSRKTTMCASQQVSGWELKEK